MSSRRFGLSSADMRPGPTYTTRADVHDLSRVVCVGRTIVLASISRMGFFLSYYYFIYFLLIQDITTVVCWIYITKLVCWI